LLYFIVILFAIYFFRKDLKGCFDQLQTFIGLTLCGELGFPNDPNAISAGAALYPLNGNGKVSVRLNKEDESLKTYHVRLQYNLKNPTHKTLELLVDTPGSKTPRKIGLLVEGKIEPEKLIHVKLETPIYNFNGKGLYNNLPFNNLNYKACSFKNTSWIESTFSAEPSSPASPDSPHSNEKLTE